MVIKSYLAIIFSCDKSQRSWNSERSEKEWWRFACCGDVFIKLSFCIQDSKVTKKRHFEIQILFIDGVLLVSNSCGFGEFLGKAPTKEVTSHIGSMKGGLGSPLCDGISFEIGATFIWHLYSSPHRVYNTRCMEGRLCKNWAPLGLSIVPGTVYFLPRMPSCQIEAELYFV